MARPSVPTIEIYGVPQKQTMHDLGKRHMPRFSQKMDVVRHKAESQEKVWILGSGVGKKMHKFGKIRLLPENCAAVVAFRNDVVKGITRVEPGFSGHDGSPLKEGFENQVLFKMNAKKIFDF